MMHYLTPKQSSSCTGYTKLATYGNKLGFSFKIFQGREKAKDARYVVALDPPGNF